MLRPAADPALAAALVQLVERTETADARRAERSPAERLEHAQRTLARSAEGLATQGFGLWLIEPEAGGEPVGWAGLKRGEDAARPELMYGLVPEARGRGLATAAVRALVAHAFTRPGVVAVWGATRPDNAPSARVMERAGLQLKGPRVLDGAEYLVFSVSRGN